MWNRTGDRRRVLLRLRRRSALRAGGSGRHRTEDERAGGGRSAVRAADVATRRSEAVFLRERGTVEGSVDRGEDPRSIGGLLLHDQGSRDVLGFLRRPARAVERTLEGIQAAEHVERVLEG